MRVARLRPRLFTLEHGPVCCVGDRKDVRWNFVPFDPLVPLHNLLGVDGKFLVRIDDDAEETRICLSIEKKHEIPDDSTSPALLT